MKKSYVVMGILSLLLTGLPLSCKSGNLGKSVRPDLKEETSLKQKCSEGEPNLRPFVIEWDATDLALFESLAQRDVVFVHYEGCELKVIDTCQDDGIPGKYGAYSPTRWTSGTVEGFDIKNEGDLYAKLPLGAASFGGHVRAGQALQLDYYVSGTTTSSRASVYEGDLAENPECSEVTHFVWAFNLGSFDLTAHEYDSENVQVGFKNVGAGGSHNYERTHLKSGGRLDSCTSDTASELAACKVPIRLALRKIKSGENPRESAPTTEEQGPKSSTAESVNPAAASEASSLRQSAMKKQSMGDGRGCLMDLDRAAELDGGQGAGNMEMARAFCEFSAGRCDDARKRYRLALEQAALGRRLTDKEIDRAVAQKASELCMGAPLTHREAAFRAAPAIQKAMDSRDASACMEHGRALIKAIPKLPKKTVEEERERSQAISALGNGSVCAGRAGNCKGAKKLYKAYAKHSYPDWKEEYVEQGFRQHVRECAGE